MIFLNTESMGVKYKNAMSRGSMAIRLFQEVLEIEDVQTFTDLTHDEIVEKLDSLKKKAEKFRIRSGSDTLFIAIAWIGFS